MKAPPCFEDPETKRLIRKTCENHEIDVDLLRDLCEVVLKYSGSGRAFGLPEEIDLTLERFITERSHPQSKGT